MYKRTHSMTIVQRYFFLCTFVQMYKRAHSMTIVLWYFFLCTFVQMYKRTHSMTIMYYGTFSFVHLYKCTSELTLFLYTIVLKVWNRFYNELWVQCVRTMHFLSYCTLWRKLFFTLYLYNKAICSNICIYLYICLLLLAKRQNLMGWHFYEKTH